MTIAPCRDCTKREIGCHSTCKDYKAYRAKHESDKMRIIEAKAPGIQIRQHKRDMVEKARKRH